MCKSGGGNISRRMLTGESGLANWEGAGNMDGGEGAGDMDGGGVTWMGVW